MINGKKVIAFSGVESTGKTTLATALVARLRSHGVLAELLYEPRVTLPFPTSFYEEGGDLPWLYQITHRIQLEIALASRKEVEVIVSDRTPLDFVGYYTARKVSPGWQLRTARDLAAQWTGQYDLIYSLERKGSVYMQDGFRAPAEINTWHEAADPIMRDLVGECSSKVVRVGGTYRERSEFVYHHVLHSLLDMSKSVRAYNQLAGWFGVKIGRVEIVPQGSRSINRFHPAGDNDDIDGYVIVHEVDPRAARELYLANKAFLESMVQADLDLTFVAPGFEPHEV